MGGRIIRVSLHSPGDRSRGFETPARHYCRTSLFGKGGGKFIQMANAAASATTSQV
jgi:hypothetical protein